MLHATCNFGAHGPLLSHSSTLCACRITECPAFEIWYREADASNPDVMFFCSRCGCSAESHPIDTQVRTCCSIEQRMGRDQMNRRLLDSKCQSASTGAAVVALCVFADRVSPLRDSCRSGRGRSTRNGAQRPRAGRRSVRAGGDQEERRAAGSGPLPPAAAVTSWRRITRSSGSSQGRRFRRRGYRGTLPQWRPSRSHVTAQRGQRLIHVANPLAWVRSSPPLGRGAVLTLSFSLPQASRAFRKLALKWHPDKHERDDEATRVAARERFIAVTRAWGAVSEWLGGTAGQ